MPERTFAQRLVNADLEPRSELFSDSLLTEPSVQEPSLAEQATVREVTDILGALSPLPAFVFVTRCAMRTRFATFLNLEGDDLLEALAQYDASIDDAVAFCLLSGGWETKVQMAGRIREAATLSNRNLGIEEAFDCFHAGGSFDAALAGLAGKTFQNLKATIQQFNKYQLQPGPGLEAGNPETVDVHLAVLPELRKLVKLGTEQSIDPTEDGPLNGLWPIGAPAGYLKFEGDPELELRLRKKPIASSIPPQERKQEATYPQEGQVAELPDTGMNVTKTSGEVLAEGCAELPLGDSKTESQDQPHKTEQGEAQLTHQLRPLVRPRPPVKPLSDDIWLARMKERGLLPRVAQAYVTFRKDLPRFLEEGRVGQWVAYHGSERLGFGQSRDELYRQYISKGIELHDLFVPLIEPGIFLEIGVEGQ